MDKPALLLTRPRDSAERFAARLSVQAMQGVLTCISPLLEIEPTGSIPDLTDANGVIFTSARAVEIAPAGIGRPAFCVGAQTAKAADKAGWSIKLVAQTADGLVATIREGSVKGPLVHLAGDHLRGHIAERLGQGGTQVEVVTLYAQHLRPLSEAAKTLLAGEVPVIVPLFSPRTAAQFLDQARCLRHTVVVAMSPAVAEVFQARPPKALFIAQEPTADEMADKVEVLLRKDRLP
ncbi:MAG: uroporphyrinogen-III synthase [Sulfitobacter sp.]